MNEVTPSELLERTEARQRKRVTLLRSATDTLRELRSQLITTCAPPPVTPPWWKRLFQKDEPTPTPPPLDTHRIRFTLLDLQDRLEVERGRVQVDLDAIAKSLVQLGDTFGGQDGGDQTTHQQLVVALSAVPVPLEHALRTAQDLIRSIAALLGVLEELACEAPAALASEGAQAIAAHADATRARVLRVVRDEEERGVLMRDHVDILVDAFDPWQVLDAEQLQAERELAKHLRSQSLDALLDRLRHSQETDREP